MSQRRIMTLTLLLTFSVAAATLSFATENAPAGKDAVDAWVQAWNGGAHHLDGFLTEDVTFKDPFFSTDGRQHFLDIVTTGRTSFSNLRFRLDELILDGDRGVLIWTGAGTHLSSGNAVETQGVSILRFEDDKIAAESRFYDSADFIRQMGGTVIVPDGGDGRSD